MTGYRIGPGISLLYGTGKLGIGIHYGRYLYEQNKEDLSSPHYYYPSTPFANVSEYGALARYKLFEKNRFSLYTQLSGGIFSINNNITSGHFSFKNKLFINPALDISYHLGKVSFSLSPNYNFMYTRMVAPDGVTVFKEYISSFNMALGLGVNILRW